MLKFSVVIPVYNEEPSIPLLYMSLKDAMDKMGQPYEIIFVDDCSTDNSVDVLSSIGSETSNLIAISLNKHSGQSVAMQAGFDTAKGELIITMDGDLQYDPKDIPNLLNKMREGYDIVCGWRYNRIDPQSKLLTSKAACALRRMITKENIHDFGCNFRIFKRTVIKNIYFSGGMHRFFTLIMFRLGYKAAEVKVEHRFRRFGHSNYNLYNRLAECLVDFIRISLNFSGLLKR